MFLVKVLEKKGVIRFFGISLILAPFINNIARIAIHTNVPNRWTLAVFWQVFYTSTLSTQFLYVASLIIGALMLSGSQKAWRYALFLMGCYIVDQLIGFGPAYRASKITALFFLVNVAVFLFIADQLVWKVKAKPSAKKLAETDPLLLLREALDKNKPLPGRSVKPETNVVKAGPVPFSKSSQPTIPFNPPKLHVEQPTEPPIENVVELRQPPVAAESRKSIPVQFEGFGSWAKLSKITSHGIHMHSLAELPFEFGSREIAVQFASGMNLRIRFSKREGQDFFFEFIDLSKDQIREINAWLKRVA